MEILPAAPTDLDDIVALFKEYRFALQEREWLEWKYFRSPDGRALHYKIIAEGKLAGAVALLPRTFHFRGRRLVGIQAVDGLMGREIRGKGLFNDVMRFLWQQRPEGIEKDYFYLSFPSLASSSKAHEHAGWHRLADFRLFTVPLRVEMLERNRRFGWAKSLAAVPWPLFQRYLFAPHAPEVEVRSIPRFHEDLGRFFGADKVHGDRSATFMNWRVIDNPQARLYAFAIADGGRSIGYAVGKLTGRTLEIIDIKLERADRRYMAALLRHICSTGIADSVDYWLLAPPGYRDLLPRLGVFERHFTGALFVHHHTECGLPDGVDGWDVNYIDSDW